MEDKITHVEDLTRVLLAGFGQDQTPEQTRHVTIWKNTVDPTKVSINIVNEGADFTDVYGVMDRESAIALRDHLTALIEGTR